MTIEGLNDFLHSLEHSASLRRELNGCKNDSDLIDLAKKNGFPVTQVDLETSEESRKVQEWFRGFNINPIKR
ncbi:Nif11-like leader peptide family natural product precursor [Prochlorococcus sp. MIT 1341]|uniref:Nif11-like leader peptide family natural product precursor n=1 Tax=Prochlorococcus sp. MIT 1341 TaxID=3096221 RepID=UPI002A754F66|nr:Nif11-like leader peptide family natural product precursor [Prochlorococcus sp. MIT 1341]